MLQRLNKIKQFTECITTDFFHLAATLCSRGDTVINTAEVWTSICFCQSHVCGIFSFISSFWDNWNKYVIVYFCMCLSTGAVHCCESSPLFMFLNKSSLFSPTTYCIAAYSGINYGIKWTKDTAFSLYQCSHIVNHCLLEETGLQREN